MQHHLPPRSARNSHGPPSSRQPRAGGRAKASLWSPRDSAEMRSPSKHGSQHAPVGSPPMMPPESPELGLPSTLSKAAASKAAAQPDGHAIVAAAATIQQRWRGAHARRRTQRLQASRAELLAKQAQLEAARGHHARTDRIDDILGQLSRAREDASASVHRRQAADRSADSRRQSDTSRQQAARRIQMQWLRCRTARRARRANGGGAAAAGLMSYLELTSVGPLSAEKAPSASRNSLTDLLAAAGAEQYRRTCSRSGRIATPAEVVRGPEPEPPAAAAVAKTPRARSPPVGRVTTLPAASAAPSSARSVAGSVRTHVSTLKSSLAARDTELKDLQQQLELSEKKRDDAQREAEETLDRKLAELRGEYDSTITRQLEFVDGLLKDKEELAEKYTTAATELEESESHWQENLKKQSSADKMQLKRHRDAWAAAEKVRRDKWMEEQMAQVKAQTIRGLEPEIQRMMAQHKSDKDAAEQNHSTALRRARDDMLEENNQNLRRVKQELQAERTDALQHERELANHRIREHAEQSEAGLRHELTSQAKLKSEWEADRTRAERDRVETRRHLEEAKEREAALVRAQSTQQEQLEACKRAHVHELEQTLANAQAEQDDLKRRLSMDESATISRARDDLRTELTKERDAQIEEVLGRLAEETESRRLSLQAQFKERVDSMLSDHRAELIQAQQDGRSWMSKYNAIFKQQANQSAELNALRTEAQMIEQQAAKGVQQAESAAAAAAAQTKSEAAQRAAEARTFASEVAAQATALQKRADELQEAEGAKALASRHHADALQHQQRDHERVLDDLNDQVRRVIREKDQSIEELRQQLAEVAEVMEM